MPHQCLSCGFAFEEGSSALLKGCPGCKGTRFFYTRDAVDADERKAIAEKAQKDLRQVVTDMLQEAAPELRDLPDDGDGWAQLKPRDLRRLVSQVKARRQEAEAPAGEGPDDAPDPESIARAEAARRRVEEELAARDGDDRPDTVTIDGPGRYDIDVRGLLERNPIVVHKDGAYVIHLPSLFDQGR